MMQHPIFAKLPGHVGPRREGFVLDYSGAEFDHAWTRQDWPTAIDGAWPLPIPPFDEEYFEWVDLLESIEQARGRFTMIELGAGYGRWGIRGAVIAKKLGLDVRLVFVEGEPRHASYLRGAIALNGLSGVSTVHEAAIAYGGEPVPFLIEHDTQDLGFGQCIGWEGRGAPTDARYFGRAVSRTPAGYGQIFVEPVTLETVLHPFDMVDLIDMDLQKAERDVVRNSISTLNAKVRRIHIGTHAPDIEEELRAAFSEAGWRKVWDFGCLRVNDTPYGPVRFVDGVQGWINPSLFASTRRSE